jgi:two-component system, sensor histidine kinase and response regulator
MTDGHILLVDDDESVRVTMQAVLESAGHTVTAVDGGARALALLRQVDFDLVLTDLRMEDVDGLMVLAEVQRLAPETISIMLTGYASLESAVKSLHEGAYAYLIKPCDVDELRATIDRGLERRRLTQQLRERVRELETANATIRTLNAGLQQRVDAATAQLTAQMDELRRARDEIATLYATAQENVERLQEVDRLKSQFLSMASHELKTPLTSISGYLQVGLKRAQRRLARGHPNAEEWAADMQLDIKQAETLNRQTRRLSRLVNELLDVSRMQTGRVEFQHEPVDIQALAQEVATRAQSTTALHAITVHSPVAGEVLVEGDADHLEQVLNNLIENAIKYSPTGGTIDVTFEANSHEIAMHVRDQGSGIAVEQQEAIFGLFYRSPDTRSHHAGGMGLGLYISNEIVQRHGGAIEVQSSPGAGSTFSVRLPRLVGGA